MIKEAYVSFEVAKLLKEKGFDGDCGDCECHMFYHEMTDRIMPIMEIGMIPDYDTVYFAPTQQMACEWLREKDIHICPKYRCFCGSKKKDVPYFLWEPTILRLSTNNIIYPQPLDMCAHYKTHKEAIEEALKYSLENLI